MSYLVQYIKYLKSETGCNTLDAKEALEKNNMKLADALKYLQDKGHGRFGF